MTSTGSHLGGKNKQKVQYFYDSEIGNYQYNVGHPMKPFRIRMTDELINAYKLNEEMEHIPLDPDYVEAVDFTLFHSDDYVDVLKHIRVDNKEHYAD